MPNRNRRNNYSVAVPQPRIPSQFPKGSTTNSRSKLVDLVEFDEYIAEVNGSATFVTTKYSINPGLAATFPEGSVEAALWTEWKMKYCRFYYKPEVSGFATQGQSGKIILACDYNAANATPTTKTQVEIMHKADGMPYEDIALELDPGFINRADSKYIRTGAQSAGTDIKTYDGGNLWVSTYGQTNTNVCGELRVHYAFIVEKPTLLNAASSADNKVSWFQSSVGEASGATTVAKVMLLATASSNGLGSVNTAGSIVPPAGNYSVDFWLNSLTSVASDQTSAKCDFQKNGVSVFTLPPLVSYGGTLTSLNTLVSGSAYVTANGSDAFTLVVTNVFSGGTQTNQGSLRLMAI